MIPTLSLIFFVIVKLYFISHHIYFELSPSKKKKKKRFNDFVGRGAYLNY